MPVARFRFRCCEVDCVQAEGARCYRQPAHQLFVQLFVTLRCCLFFCTAVAVFVLGRGAQAFDGADFWREPSDLPFDISPVEQGRDRLTSAPRGRVARGIEWRSFHFTSEIYNGQPMRVFAVYARPSGGGKFPAILSLHGGIDRANLARVEAFAREGYACLAFDWLPKSEKTSAPASRTVYAGLPYDDWGRMFAELGPDGKRPVIYRTITAARRALTWLSQQDEVDAARLGVEGHSWGGYLAQLLAGVDNRVKAVAVSASSGSWLRRYVAGRAEDHAQSLHTAAQRASALRDPDAARREVPERPLLPPPLPQESVAGSAVADVYFTGERDAIYEGHRFYELTSWQMFEWTQRYDPAAYAENIQAPTLLRVGASDFFASIDGLSDYWDKIRAPKALQLLPAGNHTFGDVETRLEWFNYWLMRPARGQPPGMGAGPYPQIGAWRLMSNADGSWTAIVPAAGPRAVTGQVAFSTSIGPSVVRHWAQRPLVKAPAAKPAQSGEVWTATFKPPPGSTLRVFVSLKDAAGRVSSTLPQVRELAARALDGTPLPVAPLQIRRTNGSPLDNAAKWNDAPETGPVTLSPEMAAERSATVRALWDKEALYLRFRIADATPWQSASGNAPWWTADSVHLRLLTGGDLPNARVMHIGLFNGGGETPAAVAYRDVEIRQQEFDLRPLTTQIQKDETGYTLTARLLWKWIDPQFKAQSGRSFRFAFLVNDGDLLTNEPILGANFNNAHALYKPEVWGQVSLD
jgi:dienelactone hydrolase